MAIEQDLKIFISWSGKLAEEITAVFRGWLPRMFDHVDPWASTIDIDAGSRGLDEIKDRLNATSFGIVVVTTENYERPWLQFEAGALSKRLDSDSDRVIPVLVNFEDVNQIAGTPLGQFQRVLLNKEGVWRICRAIAKTIGLDVIVIQDRFEQLWPDLEKKIETAKNSVRDQPPAPELKPEDMLRQLLASVDDLKALQKPRYRPPPPRPIASPSRMKDDLIRIHRIVTTKYPGASIEVSPHKMEDGFGALISSAEGTFDDSQRSELARHIRDRGVDLDIFFVEQRQ